MSSGVQHSIEIVAQKLADRMEHEAELLANFLRPEGERPPFTRRVTLEWWRVHRYDEYGSRALANMEPEEIMALDAALAAQIEAEGMAPPLAP